MSKLLYASPLPDGSFPGLIRDQVGPFQVALVWNGSGYVLHVGGLPKVTAPATLDKARAMAKLWLEAAFSAGLEALREKEADG